MILIQYLRLAFSTASKTVARGVFAFMQFWNVPAFGQTESSDGHARATYRI